MKMSKQGSPAQKGKMLAGSHQWKSVFFQADKIDKGLNLPVRGVPASWLPDERPLDLVNARQWFAPEMQLLDAMNPRKQFFTSGILGGALASLTVYPQTIDFWRLYNQRNWVRHDDGLIDAVGWLINETNRHTGYKLITLRSDYQHLEFQAALAVAKFFAECQERGDAPWLRSAPPPASIPEFVEAVRQAKGIRRSPDGFRPSSVLMGRIPRLTPAVITHRECVDVVRQISQRMCKLAGAPCSLRSQARALEVVQSMNIPTELAAPGALATAVATIAQDSRNEGIWRDAFAGRWSHLPGQGYTVAGQLVQAIRHHNRRPHGLEGELALAARCKMAIQTHHRLQRTHAEPRLKNLPSKATEIFAQLSHACAGLSLESGPEIQMGYIEPFTRRGSQNDKRCSKPQTRGATGKGAEKLFERIHAEFAFPRPGRLIDRTSNQCGYDYGIVEQCDEEEWAIETKTVKPGEQISISGPQWKRAAALGSRYWLVVILRTENGIQYGGLCNPTAHLPSREVKIVIRSKAHVVSARDWRATFDGLWQEVPSELIEDDSDPV